MKNLACRVALVATVAAGLLLSAMSPALADPDEGPSGGTHAPAPLVDLVAAPAAGQVVPCGGTLALEGDTVVECPPPLGGPPAPGDLAAPDAAVEEELPPGLGLDLVPLVCGLTVALVGTAAAPCPPAPAEGTPPLVVDLPVVGALELAAPLNVCRLLVVLLGGDSAACPP